MMDETKKSKLREMADFTKLIDPIAGNNILRTFHVYFKENENGTFRIRQRDPYIKKETSK